MENLYDIVFIHLGSNCIYEMKYEQHCDSVRLMNKPHSGFWGSRYTIKDEYKSSWDRFNSKNRLRKYNGKEVLFKVKKGAPVLVLDDIEKLDSKYVNLDVLKEKEELRVKLMKMQPGDEGFMDILFEYNAMGLSAREKLMNWKCILEDFKGVYLTEEALYGVYGEAFNFWDVESIVIFDTSIIEEYVE